VFSGKGSKILASRRGRRNGSNSTNKMLECPATLSHESTEHVALLRELQCRLGSIELAEELEASNTATVSDGRDVEEGIEELSNLPLRRNLPEKGVISKDFFMGVSGNMLSELKEAISISQDNVQELEGS